jgi:hypothetical protein
MPVSNDHDQLQLDYTQTTQLLRDLADTRLKLVALVPTISGAAVALLSRHPTSAQLLAVGALGLAATAGVVVYELGNSRLRDYALQRAARLERSLGTGGLFGERPDRRLRLLGLELGTERGLALVFGAAVGGWAYLLAWGALHSLGVHESQRTGGAIGLLAGLLVLIELTRIQPGAPAAESHGTSAPGRTATG